MKLLPFKAIFPNTKKYSFVLNQEKLYANNEASLKIDQINYNQYLLEQYKRGYFLKTFDEHIYLVKKETLNYSSIGIIAKINTDDLHSSKLKLHEEIIKDKVFEYHHLTPMVLDEAEKGDTVCLNIIKEAAEKLYENIEAVAKNIPGESKTVSFLGGLLENNTLVSKELLNRIKKGGNFTVIDPKGTALDGAIEISYELASRSEDI